MTQCSVNLASHYNGRLPQRTKRHVFDQRLPLTQNHHKKFIHAHMPLTSRKAKVMSQVKENLDEEDTYTVDTQDTMTKDERYVTRLYI